MINFISSEFNLFSSKRKLIDNTESEKITIYVDRLTGLKNETVEIVLHYIYCGRICLESEPLDSLFNLLGISRHIGLSKLENALLYHLSAIVDVKNVVNILEMSFLLDEDSLKKKCLRFIDEHSSQLIERKALRQIPLLNLVSVIQRDTFCQCEMNIYKLVRDWHQFNELLEMNEGIFECLRLSLMSKSDLLDILVDLKNDRIKKFVSDEVKKQQEKENETVFVEIKDGKLRSAFRALVFESNGGKSLIFQFGNPIQINYLQVKFIGQDGEKR